MTTEQDFKTGDRVSALTFASIEYDRPPLPVTGTLEVHWVPTLKYTQYLVDGVPVVPRSLRRLEEPTTNKFGWEQ